MTKRAAPGPDRIDALYDELFADVAELPTDAIRAALAEAGVSREALRGALRSRAAVLASSLASGHTPVPEYLQKLAGTIEETAGEAPRHDARRLDRAASSSYAASHWTNASVMQLAAHRDPVDTIIQKARDLVTRALDCEWHGPPFDPMRLAEICGIEVRPVADVPDARTVPIAADKFCIEFNPNRPVRRVRYSLAHEIAHTLFSDCGELVRNRSAHSNATPDEWQLEALCNIAAAELLMPFGSFPSASPDLVDIDRILVLRKQFKVSTEALLLRVVHLARIECAVFSASQISEGRYQGRWRVDYVVGSPQWTTGNLRGLLAPAGTHLQYCSKPDFTMREEEVWGGHRLRIEAVALPSYPGSITPRVAGFLIVPGSEPIQSGLTEIHGNALEPRGAGQKLIIHVVTDKAETWGGRGFAMAVRRKWPHVHEDFSAWAGLHGKNLKLGQVRFCEATHDIRVASLVAQHGYGKGRGPRIRYAALAQGVTQAFGAAADAHESIHLPRIGTGYGGGSWPVIRDILEEAIAATGVRATVYELPSSTTTPRQGELGFNTEKDA
jgi:O-acetyl-ADP-ribose deacetylase (regulator of RNase III)